MLELGNQVSTARGDVWLKELSIGVSAMIG